MKKVRTRVLHDYRGLGYRVVHNIMTNVLHTVNSTSERGDSLDQSDKLDTIDRSRDFLIIVVINAFFIIGGTIKYIIISL